MIRYILVDDDPRTLEKVKTKINAIANDYDLQHVASFNSSKKAFEEINEDDYDLLIVDFDMPVYNGIELAKKIATGKKIIFLTSTTDNEKLVINNLDISGYLSKPFEIDEFQKVLKNKVIGKTNISTFTKNANLITLHIGRNRDVRFKPELVYYISTTSFDENENINKNCVHIYGENNEILYKNVRKNISELYKELEVFNFEKISQSTIINLTHIKERDNTNISLYGIKHPFEVTSKEKLGLIAKLRAKFR
ncbi:LytR/AlgR family response regulator transcription factor [Polaribacter atrinae]|uniref:LytR/AlgR family response regulator transcription factor n=1 Tax=Polaribacter atrinae TaxID=1333662 RepID=UPI0030F74900